MLERTFFILCFGLASISGIGQSVISVDTIHNSPSYGTFYVEDSALNWSDLEELAQRFKVYVKGANNPLFGDYFMTERGVGFRPRFRPDSQVDYTVIFWSEEDGVVAWDTRFPKLSAIPIEIRVFPEVTTVPSNILRAYIYFSRPMGLENPYDFIQLLDETGSVMMDPFVEIKEGLWNHDRTRLTLFFHPGRIKRGVGPNEVMGPVFKPGERYTLQLSKDWKEAYGNDLGDHYSFNWLAADPVRDRLNLSEWKVIGRNDQVEIRTKQLLDKEIVKHSLIVQNGEVSVSGKWIQSTDGVVFKPSIPFEKGRYRVVISPRLEDICGNNFNSAFEEEDKINNEVIAEKLIYFSVE